MNKIYNKNKISKSKLYLFGFSRWKHRFVRVFFKEYDSKNIFFINPIFSSHLNLAIKKGLDKNSDIFIWGKKDFQEIADFADENNINISIVEDGFIRSVGLGSDLTQPYSLVVDNYGVYFDPKQPSLLENILKSYDFKSDKMLVERAKLLVEMIIENKISKYNADADKKLSFNTTKRVVLVPGQVEDDASIQFGADGMTNLELLKNVRFENNDAYIVFKPHPDVLSGNRIGNIIDNEALKYCDEILMNVSMASVLEVVDEVHTMTSLVGFESLLYGKKVVTYGLPFYAGWGLSEDKKECKRRDRKLTLYELIAGTLLLYPRYIHPETKEFCEVEILIAELQKKREKLNNSFYDRVKFKIYIYLSRIAQKLLKLVK